MPDSSLGAGHKPKVVKTVCGIPRAFAERRMFPGQGSILGEITLERERQDAKWGGQPGVDRMDDHTYAAVLGEEFGECCKAWLERDMDALRQELVQTAAVAVAWIEEIDHAAGHGANGVWMETS